MLDENILKRILISTGLNKRFFCDENLSFDQYIKVMQEVLLEARADLTINNFGEIVTANSPFSWKPNSNQKMKNGVLLIHGLFDSPFQVRDLGAYFYQKNFLVRAVLLPGHGTVPGDLLDVGYQEWVRAVEFGVNSLSHEVDNIFLAGYSLGGLLSLHSYLYGKNTHKIKGMILFAPALKPRSAVKTFLVKYHHLFAWFFKDSKWFQLSEHTHFTKYNSYALNAAKQATMLMTKVKNGLKKRSIDIPLFTIISTDDETICNKAVFSFFQKQPNSNNKLIIYTNDEGEEDDQRIIKRKSFFPDLRILNFSHICMTISPENYHLGILSNRVDFHHYRNVISKFDNEDFYFGAATKENLKRYKISRLSYNPDFKYLLKLLDEFLNPVVSIKDERRSN